MHDVSPYLRVDDVARLTGFSKREVWRKVSSEPGFPKKRKLSTRRAVWFREEVLQYVERQKAALA